MAFLTPDKVITIKVGRETLKINQKLIPDGMRATKNVAKWVPKGAYMKPNVPLGYKDDLKQPKYCGPKGIPMGESIHNTPDIKVAEGTNAAEQYTRATFNGNMNGVVVQFYVKGIHIWQNLRLDEQGWHAKDNKNQRLSHRAGQMMGGNLNTVAIECIGNDPESERTTAILTAYLCRKFGHDPMKDVYTHNYWMYGKDEIVKGAPKNCPQYILPHWKKFLEMVKKFYDEDCELSKKPEPKPSKPTDKDELIRIQCGAYKNKSGAETLAAELKKRGFSTYLVNVDGLWKVQVGAYSDPENAKYMEKKIKDAGYKCFIVYPDKKPEPKPSKPKAPAFTSADVGKQIKVKKTAKEFTNGVKMQDWVKGGTFYIRKVEKSGKVLLISTKKTGSQYTGRIYASDAERI